MRVLVWLLVLACVACAVPASKPAPSASPPPAAATRGPESPLLPVYADDLSWGSPDPLVTVVAFLDFSEQESRRWYLELAELVETNSELRLVVKHAPLAQAGEPIAEACLAERAIGRRS